MIYPQPSNDSSDFINHLDISISTIERKSYSHAKKNETQKINSKNKLEITKNNYFSLKSEKKEKYNIPNSNSNSFISITLFTSEFNNKNSRLSYHLYKNRFNEIYIFKPEEENIKIKEESSEEEKEEKKEKGKKNCKPKSKNNLPNKDMTNISYFKECKFICFDNSCKGEGSLYIDLSKPLDNNFNYIFKITNEHSLTNKNHSYSYSRNLKSKLHTYLDMLKSNSQIKNIQLINEIKETKMKKDIKLQRNQISSVSELKKENFKEPKDKIIIPLDKDIKFNFKTKLTTNKIYKNEIKSKAENQEDDCNNLKGEKNIKNNIKRKKTEGIVSLNIKRHRKPYNSIKQKNYTFRKSYMDTLVYAEEKFSNVKDANLGNSAIRKNWFTYIHKKYGPRTRLGPHFHKSKKDNIVYKYVIKHMLTGFEDKTLHLYCPLKNCSGKGIMNLKDEIFIEVKGHDISLEKHFFRGHKIINDYYNNHPEIRDIQVLRIQNKKY